MRGGPPSGNSRGRLERLERAYFGCPGGSGGNLWEGIPSLRCCPARIGRRTCSENSIARLFHWSARRSHGLEAGDAGRGQDSQILPQSSVAYSLGQERLIRRLILSQRFGTAFTNSRRDSRCLVNGVPALRAMRREGFPG